ncbi:MAG TPA: hypothetical protein VE987_06025, partial [Polyangiaceae bacterium]|nr:hypothetical protein [Polyangiaceae bacterium]
MAPLLLEVPPLLEPPPLLPPPVEESPPASGTPVFPPPQAVAKPMARPMPNDTRAKRERIVIEGMPRSLLKT